MVRTTPPLSRHLSPQIWKSRIAFVRSALKERVRGYEYGKTITLAGDVFAKASTQHAQKYYDSNVVFSYDADREIYIASNDPEYFFTAPARFKYFVHSLEHRGQQLFDEYLLDSIPFEDGDSIVETGGNDGDFSLALKRLGKRLSLDSFEPSPREFETLSANVAAMTFYDHAEVHNFALWNSSDETLEFHVKSGTADSSIHPIEGASDVIKVKTKRLDDVLPRKPYKLLKLEAEGAEPEILEGATGVLDCFDYVTVDVGFERGLKQESTLPQVTNILLNSGFSVVRFGKKRHVVLYENNKLRA